MDLEKYVIEIEHFGKLEAESDNIFFALEALKNELNKDIKFNIISVHVIKNNDFLIDITDFVNGIG